MKSTIYKFPSSKFGTGTLLITGSNGFVGTHLCEAVTEIASGIYLVDDDSYSFNTITTPPLECEFDWTDTLIGVETVVHLAARAHLVNGSQHSDKVLFQAINFEGTKNLAQCAARAGVKKFIFMSSIGVNGSSTPHSLPFTSFDIPSPISPYAISKLDAEQELLKISSTTNMNVVIVRAPMVYGYGAKGNFSRLLKFINYGIPMPFKSINNRRSYIGVNNLVDSLIKCIIDDRAAGNIFLVSDGEDLTIGELIYKISLHSNSKICHFQFPVVLLLFFGRIFGRVKDIDRLVDSLEIDISHIQKVIDWTPPFTVDEQLAIMFRRGRPKTDIDPIKKQDDLT